MPNEARSCALGQYRVRAICTQTLNTSSLNVEYLAVLCREGTGRFFELRDSGWHAPYMQLADRCPSPCGECFDGVQSVLTVWFVEVVPVR